MRQKSHEMKDNKELWILGHRISLHPTSGNYDLAIFETPPNSQGPPPHSHAKYEESFLIVEGEMQFWINDELRTCSAGQSVDVPPGTLHTFSNVSEAPCKWVNIHSPKGFSNFFKTFGVPLDEPNALQKSVSEKIIGEVIANAKDYDMDIAPPNQA